jgi:RNA polymerase sigma factor (sigma-70 family)
VPLASDAIEALYRRHAPGMHRRARHILGNEADAHEVLQDLFLSLLERPEQFHGSSSMTTFLYSATTHACLNRLRNQRTRTRILSEQGGEPPFARGAAINTPPDVSVLLRSALSALPEQLAEVAVYHYLDELTHDDIARILGCSRRHVGDLLKRVHTLVQQEEAVSC